MRDDVLSEFSFSPKTYPFSMITILQYTQMQIQINDKNNNNVI